MNEKDLINEYIRLGYGSVTFGENGEDKFTLTPCGYLDKDGNLISKENLLQLMKVKPIQLMEVKPIKRIGDYEFMQLENGTLALKKVRENESEDY